MGNEMGTLQNHPHPNLPPEREGDLYSSVEE